VVRPAEKEGREDTAEMKVLRDYQQWFFANAGQCPYYDAAVRVVSGNVRNR
jgi:hypothetical protein